MPHGTVNIHGHIHDKQSPTPNLHINASVEQLNYAPVKLKDVRRLARRLLERRNVYAGERTERRLYIVKTTMP